MPSPKVNGGAQVDNGIAFAQGIIGLQQTMNTNKHLNASVKAAFSLLANRFELETASLAASDKENYHHMYEPGHTGNPKLQLFNTVLRGRGGNRVATWTWRASRVLVDPRLDGAGQERFGPSQPKGFDPEKLNKVHVFVWRAPIMEYGIPVTVRPKLMQAGAGVLVFPRGSSGRGTFSKRPQRLVPGAQVQGNFSAWFAGWWSGGPAQEYLNKGFDKRRDSAFKNQFRAEMASAKITAPGTKTMSIASSAPTLRGQKFAQRMSEGLEHRYSEMAQRRKDVMQGGKGEYDE